MYYRLEYHCAFQDNSEVFRNEYVIRCAALFFLFASSLAFSALVLDSFHQHFAMGRGNKAKMVREEDRAEEAASASRRITKTCLRIQSQIASMTLSDS